MLENWKHSEPFLADASTKFGSGYPSDPICKQWMKDNLQDSVFGFPDVVRFSWGPAKKQILEEGVPLVFAADEDDDDDDDGQAAPSYIIKKRQQEHLSSFLSGAPKRAKQAPYFEKRKLRPVTAI